MNADVGKGCNIAGLSGTATFDGQAKHRVEIGDHVFIGAGTIMVGPMSVGDDVYTAAGSVLVSDVPSGALASSRSRQLIREGWVAANRTGPEPGLTSVPPGSPSTAAGSCPPARE